MHPARRTIAALACALAAACGGADPTAPAAPTPPAGGTTGPTTTPPVADTIPTLPREFRGVWIATVVNIDWPSTASRGNAAQQQAELATLLDRAAAARLNAVVLQVRPAADALYRSALEPWSAYLTGTQGVDPGWDPLAWAVEQAHARGLELHAWVNPFRAAYQARDTVGLAATHVFRTRRDLVRVYGTALWLDPGEAAARDRSLAAIIDIVRRYDVDGVHLDDYFYPYRQGTLDFPDSATYARAGTTLSRADWRRENIDRFVQALYDGVHAVKPWVKVGIAPFGIWRPGNPPGIVGLDAYAEIYADSRKWLASGWVDYFSPQLYWRIAPPAQSYTALLDWWIAQNARGRHVWPGLAAYKIYEGTDVFQPSDILDEVAETRARAARGATGVLLYNATSTLTKPALATALAASPFQQVALVPASPWLDALPPARPRVTVADLATDPGKRAWTIAWEPAAADDDLRWWVVRVRVAGAWTTLRPQPADRRSVVVRVDDAPGVRLDVVAVSAIDRVGNASDAAVWRTGSVIAADR